MSFFHLYLLWCFSFTHKHYIYIYCTLNCWFSPWRIGRCSNEYFWTWITSTSSQLQYPSVCQEHCTGCGERIELRNGFLEFSNWKHGRPPKIKMKPQKMVVCIDVFPFPNGDMVYVQGVLVQGDLLFWVLMRALRGHRGRIGFAIFTFQDFNAGKGPLGWRKRKNRPAVKNLPAPNRYPCDIRCIIPGFHHH